MIKDASSLCLIRFAFYYVIKTFYARRLHDNTYIIDDLIVHSYYMSIK